MRAARWLATLAICMAGMACLPASATYSIVACDDDGNCGAAVATHNLAVGATVIHARAGVGALASQFETHTAHGPSGLALLARGRTPGHVATALLDADGGFDGGSVRERQLGIVDARGRVATYTGSDALASAWAGALEGEGFTVQGNGLVSADVLHAMAGAYRRTGGPLEQRLMAALVAGHRAGGQAIGAMSAALRVATIEGGFNDIDLRVDGAADPLGDLQRLFDQRQAHQWMLRAERAARRGEAGTSAEAVREALRLAHGWDRIWRRAARLAMQHGDRDAALDRLAVLVAVNPAWARRELDDPLYAPLHDLPQVARWRAVPQADPTPTP